MLSTQLRARLAMDGPSSRVLGHLVLLPGRACIPGHEGTVQSDVPRFKSSSSTYRHAAVEADASFQAPSALWSGHLPVGTQSWQLRALFPPLSSRATASLQPSCRRLPPSAAHR